MTGRRRLAGGLPPAAIAVIGVIFAFEMLPILVVAVASFGSAGYVEVPPRNLSLVWYGVLFAEGKFASPLSRSFILAGLAVAISVVIATPSAYALTRFRFRFRRILDAVTLMPIIVPEIILAIALLQLWAFFGGTKSFGLGVVGHSLLVFPFVLRTTIASLASLPPEIEEAAIGLGASRFTTFRRVVLPHARIGLLAGCILGTIVSLDAFFMSLFLANRETLPIAIWHILRHDFNPSMMALATLMIVLTIILFIVVERVFGLASLVEKTRQ